MSQSTEVAVATTTVHDVTDTRRIEAHAISTQTPMALAAAMVEVHARTEGLPLAPLGSWFHHSAYGVSLAGHLAVKHGSPAHEQRRLLHEWAEALGAGVTESRSYDSRVKLKAVTVLGGIPVTVQVEVDHQCTCTGQCNGADL